MTYSDDLSYTSFSYTQCIHEILFVIMMIARMQFLLTLLAFQVSNCEAFFLNPQYSFLVSKSRLSLVKSKFFQLEEMEDKETCSSEIFFAEDNTVTVGDTDGPLFSDASGTWEEGTNGSFKMTLKRTYESGTHSSDIGEFKFDVERSFVGELAETGSKTSVTGTIHSLDELLGDRTVGYFSLIYTYDVRPKTS